MTAWLSIVAASLLGSLHCVGMCGGLISFYSATERSSEPGPARSRWAPHAAYHMTRLTAYMALGAVAGGLGSALDVFGSRLGLGNLGLFVAGSTLLLWGVPLLLGRRPAHRLLSLGRSATRPHRLVLRLQAFFVALASYLRQRPPVWRASALGLTSALLPCGWLYAFVVLAAATGSWLAGAGLLFAFWSGTVPALLGLGVGAQRLGERLRSRLPKISAALVLTLAAFNIITRWPAASAGEPGALSAATAPHCHATP